MFCTAWLRFCNTFCKAWPCRVRFHDSSTLIRVSANRFAFTLLTKMASHGLNSWETSVPFLVFGWETPLQSKPLTKKAHVTSSFWASSSCRISGSCTSWLTKGRCGICFNSNGKNPEIPGNLRFSLFFHHGKIAKWEYTEKCCEAWIVVLSAMKSLSPVQ